ncbi:phage tail fiber protein [Microbacterium sp.]|uniref:phage tail fiber protein n=1 Tax=Microbacterium sp. TaxID=51671 RepID=UPI003F7044FB
MAIRNVTKRNELATKYGADDPYGALFTADPGTADAATNEVAGGSPAYARKNMTWGSASAGAITSAATPFDVPSGTTVRYFGVASATTGATIGDSTTVTDQLFSSQGVYTVTATYTQS